ncbi:MAG TPA: winged helix-turn-helix domain-containing protein [Solirubrobacterales bacterium]|nr:winged helix-turn-helix domain-containing protein [Solirubrobacterales bacterium]
MILALSDPFRLALVTRLALGPASAAELAADLDVPVEQVRYQLKRLRAAGIVTIHGEREHRGAVERTFVADGRKLVFRGEELAGLPERELRGHDTELLRIFFREVVEAARTGSLFDEDEHFLVRMPLLLDAQGFREVGERFEAALDRLLEVRTQCLARLEEAGEKPRSATSAFFFFEIPK